MLITRVRAEILQKKGTNPCPVKTLITIQILLITRELKWQYHDIFWHFFMKLTHLINRLKWFCIRFRGDIREISDSRQANTAWSFAGINFVFAGLSMP